MAIRTEMYDAYAQTILELPGVPGGRIDLRRTVDDAALAALASVGLARSFAVLTAENPHGDNDEDAPSHDVERDRDAVNDAQLATLVDALGRAHTPFVRVDGTASDGSYRERCVAVMLPRDESVALARRFGQLALFWFDGAAFWLLPAEAGEPPRRLPFGETG